MSAIRNSLPSQQPAHWYPPPNPVQTQHPLPDDTGRIIFTRQLWQRTMPDEDQTEQGVLNQSHSANAQASQTNASAPSRRTSSTVSLRSQRRSPSPSHGSKTPLTPEESPPFRTTRKRSAGLVQQEDKALDSADTTPAHSRGNSGDSAVHVCICQPDPKVPRPRNAFILYRQNHQASVAAQHPGLANPDISKIIGEQWQNQPPEEKNRWKSLAEEEKLRHQQQYPTYRYQPKRTGRRNSLTGDTPGSAGEKPKCHKCGGRTILTPFTPSSGAHNGSVPPTPGSAITPVTRTLPVLRDLSLQSPAGRRMGRLYTASGMSPNYYSHPDERDEVGPLSPGNKRRRYNGDHAPSINRAMPPRYGAPPGGVAVGPGTPFPFVQGPPPHPYPPAAVHVRRESLPGLRGVMSPPGPMAPPPRPGMGYQQHRLSQGHVPHDRSLTLPPLQTGGSGASGVAATAGKTAEEQIMNINFRYKIKVLSQVAPPAPKAKDIPRGPLIAVEGDDVEAVKELAGWLTETLSAGSELSVNLLEGPVVDPQSTKEEAFAQYHRLAAEWLSKSKEITESITVKMLEKNADAAMPDAALASATTSPQSNRKIDERYDDSSDDASSRGDKMQEDESANSEKAGDQQSSSQKSEKAEAEKMDIDKRNSTASTTSASATKVSSGSVKPVSIIPNYSLHTSNTYARHIPIGPSDPYSPNDHWQWTATQWRGIIGPDLTIYVRDAVSGESGRPSFEIEPVEGRPDVALFVVRREGDGVEASLLRRVGFEVSEWVRAFGGRE